MYRHNAANIRKHSDMKIQRILPEIGVARQKDWYHAGNRGSQRERRVEADDGRLVASRGAQLLTIGK